MTMTDERLAELDAVSQTIHGEPFAETINKILCEYSAWVAMPNKDVAEKVAFAALVKATMITDCTDNATIDAQAATIARLTGAAKSLLALCEQAGLADDLLAAVFPDSKNRSGQTRDETAKQARRTMNEARAALGAASLRAIAWSMTDD